MICGSAMLIQHDLDEHLYPTPWLAGVYVKPEFRGRGLATILIERIAQQARALNFHELYLYTPGDESLYKYLGWSTLERSVHCGTRISIMTRQLALL